MNVREIHQFVSQRVCERYAYYDHLELWLDTQAKVFDRKARKLIAIEGATVRPYLKKMSEYNPLFRQKVEFEQVNNSTLRIIDEILLKAACGYLINRIEIAVDWVCASPQDARDLQWLIEQSFIHDDGKQQFHYNKFPPEVAESPVTSYFADNENHKIIPVVYSDSPKQLSGNQPCTHFEYRLCNTEVCKSKGFRVIRNLSDGDNIQFLKDHVNFVKKPSLEEVGKVVPGEPISSPSGLRKRCHKYWYDKGITYADITAQELLSHFPTLRSGVMAKSKDYHQAMLRALLG